MACSEGETLSDLVWGFELILSPGWHALPPGDDAWVQIYGDHKSKTEKDVKHGLIQDFVLPLGTDDARTLSLAVYVLSLERPITLDELADGYQETLTTFAIDGFGPGELVERRDLNLSAGPAVRLESTLPYNGDGYEVDDHVVAYVVADDRQAYYLVFRGDAPIIGRHFDEFTCMAGSLRLIPQEAD